MLLFHGSAKLSYTHTQTRPKARPQECVTPAGLLTSTVLQLLSLSQCKLPSSHPVVSEREKSEGERSGVEKKKGKKMEGV